jgi:hypothetical protein
VTYWRVVAVEEVVAAAAAGVCVGAAALAAVVAVIVEVVEAVIVAAVEIEVAASAARRPCRDLQIVHHQSVVPAVAADLPVRGLAMAICRHPVGRASEAGPVWGVDPAAVISQVARAACDPASAVDLRLET